MEWYNRRRDGKLEDYIENCKQNRINNPMFKGYRHYKMLWDRGFIDPNIACIRLMNKAGYDECYLVIGEFALEGIEMPAHSGKQGIHDPRKILSSKAPHFYAEPLNPHPVPRKFAG